MSHSGSHSDHRAIMHSNSNTASNYNISPSSVMATPPSTPPPLLLLEGDEMFVSRAGESRTVYHLEGPCGRDLVLEESYDIERARKKMSLLGSDSDSDIDMVADNAEFDGGELRDIFSFELQEINHGVQNGSGTGSMSWDSSIGEDCVFMAIISGVHCSLQDKRRGSHRFLYGICSTLVSYVLMLQ